MTSDGFLTLF